MERDDLKQRIEVIKERVEMACDRAGRSKNSVRLIAVTKLHPVTTVQAVIDAGIRDIGENRTREIEEKAPQLRGEFNLHMIGHLQSNKAGRILSHIGWIQSIDRERIIKRIESLWKPGEKLPSLVEVNTSGEPSKNGCSPDECYRLCERVVSSNVLDFRGLMTIGPLQGGEKETRKAFSLLRELGEKCNHFTGEFELSMGMSGDFEWAIEEGSTMVRIGSALVGERPK
jgi:PLP dependent protein